MITGQKILDLLDNRDKNDRDLIRYVCAGLQAYSQDQVPTDVFKSALLMIRGQLAYDIEFHERRKTIISYATAPFAPIESLEKTAHSYPGIREINTEDELESKMSLNTRSIDEIDKLLEKHASGEFIELRDMANSLPPTVIADFANILTFYWYEPKNIEAHIANDDIPEKGSAYNAHSQAQEIIETVRKSGREYYKPNEAAIILGVSLSMIYKLTSELGELGYAKIGSATRIPVKALLEYQNRINADPHCVKNLIEDD